MARELNSADAIFAYYGRSLRQCSRHCVDLNCEVLPKVKATKSQM